jgi:hypothetical protein
VSAASDEVQVTDGSSSLQLDMLLEFSDTVKCSAKGHHQEEMHKSAAYLFREL